MSDTSKLTPKEYKAKTDAQVRGEPYREIAEDLAKTPFVRLATKQGYDELLQQYDATLKGTPMQTVPFQPGQVVYYRRGGKFIFRASNEGTAWCERHPDEPAHNDRYENILLSQLSAIDPNAAPANDDAPLTEEWLRKVGLWDGIGIDENEGFMMFGECGDKPIVIRTGHCRTDSGKYAPGVKTIGDARSLCRLLGVEIKE